MSAVRRLEEQQEQAVQRGMCKCLCGRPRAASSDYDDWASCRHRAHRALVRARAQDSGLDATSSLSLAAVDRLASRTVPTGQRRRDAQIGRKAPRRRKPSDVRVGIPRLEQVARDLLGPRRARELVDAVLSERQRKAVPR